MRAVDLLGTAAVAVLGLTFLWAATMKVTRPQAWLGDVRRHRTKRWLRIAAFFLVPAAELAVVVALLAGQRSLAAALAAVCLVGFSLAIVRLRVLLHAGRVPCGCFGGSGRRDWRLLLARNGALLAVALLAGTAG
jgi:hypothetical protein